MERAPQKTGPTPRQRIWGWYFFDWASQPYHTLLITFIFGPYFASVAAAHFMGTGLGEEAADARAQSLWSLGLTCAGLVVGFGGPVMGALADASARRMPWILFFSTLYITGASALWYVLPDGSNLAFGLVAFGIGFVGAEFALIVVNGQLPSLGRRDEIGKLSGSGFSFGYLGGFVALVLALLLFVEQPSGRTIAGLPPLFGLAGEGREGTRFIGPFVALWFAFFMIPYLAWVREVRKIKRRSPIAALRHLANTIRALPERPSLASFLAGSMFYRDALNGLYGFGGTYAALVLNWDITRIGVFGIVSVLSAAAMSWTGGRFDARFGPKPVILACTSVLALICLVIASMDRTLLLGMPLPPGSALPDTVFMICGVLIGGLGGVVQSASRSLMVRHTDPETPTEGFGLFGLAGRATSFLAPALIGAVTLATGSARLGVLPLFALFLLGLLLLRWTRAEGDCAAR
ncbi:MAG: MFS transporter [Silicimonas sp.]|nr:MFS transporter [Silicimonas sp.]